MKLWKLQTDPNNRHKVFSLLATVNTLNVYQLMASQTQRKAWKCLPLCAVSTFDIITGFLVNRSSFRKHSFSQFFDEHLNWLNIDKCLTYPTRLRQMASHTLTNAIEYTIQTRVKWHMNAHVLLLEKNTKCFSHLINPSQPFDLELVLSTVHVRVIMIVSPFNDYNIYRNIQILTK